VIDTGPLGREPYHLGAATTDVAAAQATLATAFGFTWGPIASSVAPGLAAPDEPVAWTCRRCHTMGGPFHVELLQGSAGSIWDTRELLTLHHLAYWSDDVERDIVELVAGGWTLEATLRDDAGRPEEFAYLNRPGSLRVELVASHRRAAYLAAVEP
jgi:Glyoxalase/Bleomycin resistance protein/Dioxygenase superfamily